MPENATAETPFDRLKLVLGEERLKRLQDATVMVLGLGGVGSNCTEALARGGVGHLILIDRDTVAPSNINRQAIAFHSTIGLPKCQVMEKMVLEINPSCQVETLQAFIPKDGLGEMLSQFPRPDYIIDAIDTVSQKLALAKWCQDERIPLLSSMGGANKLDPSRLAFSKIEKTSGDRLAKAMRKNCRKRGIKGLEVLYSTEKGNGPKPPKTKDGKRPDKGLTLGTMSYMPPIMGQMIAGKVICRLAGFELMPYSGEEGLQC